MRKQSFALWLAVLLASTALVSPASGFAQGRGSESGGTHEGITVHGHWTVEVRNADGTLETHREFENALSNGANTIAPMLGRADTVGLWWLGVGYDITKGLGPCFDTLPGPCVIVESNDPHTGPPFFHNLTISAPFPPDPNAGTLTLAGSFTAQIAGQILEVSTAVDDCAPTVAPASCLKDNYHFNFDAEFSFARVNPISVTVGQLVLVSVVYSFS